MQPVEFRYLLIAVTPLSSELNSCSGAPRGACLLAGESPVWEMVDPPCPVSSQFDTVEEPSQYRVSFQLAIKLL